MLQTVVQICSSKKAAIQAPALFPSAQELQTGQLK
jgi:hypothetical protein